MRRTILAQEWFSAAELASMGLPGMPATKQNIIARAKREAWAEPGQKGVWWRDRAGRGGGIEFHLCVLPMAAQAKLTMDLSLASDRKGTAAPDESACHERWAWFDRLTEKKKAVARERLDVLHTIRELTNAGVPKVAAVRQVAQMRRVSATSIYNWETLVHRVPRTDWLPFLAPRHAGRTNDRTEFDSAAWDFFITDYLRLEAPTLLACYRRLFDHSDPPQPLNGWSVPCERTVARRVEALPQAMLVLAREGKEALARMYPSQRRDRSTLHALEAVNADFHKWDVFVRFPDGVIDRPQMVAFQDIHSGKMLAWRICRTPNRCAVRLAFGDLVERYGIPNGCVLDNGREFASKWITGGVSNRYRFKVRDDEPAGLLVQMGVEVHWATPYHGQSKPIERMFKDFAGDIAKHPAFAGAYTGNTPLAKPENYGSKAVPFDTFLSVLQSEIAAHNARSGRTGGICAGRSLDQVFAESYPNAKIKKASAEQRRLWLLAAEARRVDRITGELTLEGNRFWSDELHELRGELVTIRFDPDNLQLPLHVYRPDGAYLGDVPCLTPVGFFDADAARDHARARKHFVKATGAALDAQRKMKLADVAAQLPAHPTDPEPPENRVVAVRFGNTMRRAPMPELAEQTEVEKAMDRANARYLRPYVVGGDD